MNKKIKRGFSIVELFGAFLVITLIIVIGFYISNGYIKNYRTTETIAKLSTSYSSNELLGKKVDGKKLLEVMVLGTTSGSTEENNVVRYLNSSNYSVAQLNTNNGFLVAMVNPTPLTGSGLNNSYRVDGGNSDNYFLPQTNPGTENIDKISQFSKFLIFGSKPSTTPTGTIYIGTGTLNGTSTLPTYIYKLADSATTGNGNSTGSYICKDCRIFAGNFDTVFGTKYGVWKYSGYNQSGEFGNGGSIYWMATTTTYLPASGVKDIIFSNSTYAFGYQFSYLLMNDGTVKASGYGAYGEIGYGGSYSYYYIIPNNSSNTKKIVTTSYSTYYSSVYLLKNDGTVWVTGYNGNGNLGLGGTSNSYSFTQVLSSPGVPLINVKDVFVYDGDGYYTTAYFLMNDGTVKAVGNNTYGQLGIGNYSNQYYPVTVSGLSNIKDITVGDGYALFLKTDGTVYGVGSDTYGQIAGGGSTRTSVNLISGLMNISKIYTNGASTYGSTLFLKTDGTVVASGYNGYGQLGVGNTINQYYYTSVTGLSNVVSISYQGDLYYTYAVALLSDGTIRTWGYNGYYGLGNGNGSNQSAPQNIGLSGITQITCGYHSCFAIKEDGTTYNWGYGNYYQFGDGGFARSSPVINSGM